MPGLRQAPAVVCHTLWRDLLIFVICGRLCGRIFMKAIRSLSGLIQSKLISGIKSLFKKSVPPSTIFFTNEVLTVHSNTGDTHCKWRELQSIIGYKVDQITIDCLVIELYFPSTGWQLLHEDMKGWSELSSELTRLVPGICQTWWSDLCQPPFARNLMVLYDHENRQLAEVLRRTP